MATDGESYGHHHRFGEMALAAAIRHVEQRGLGFSSYGAFLAAWPAGRPMAEAELVEPSAWSCAHGVERWRSDCGCRVGGPERHQRWRAPLREALDWLAGELDLGFESLGGALLKDPWAARDDYVGVLLQPAARDGSWLPTPSTRWTAGPGCEPSSSWRSSGTAS